MSFRTSAFSFSRNTDPGGGGESLLSDMFSPTIPESLPSYPPGGRRFTIGRGTTVMVGGNKIQHLPPPPSPSTRNAHLPTSAGRGLYGLNNYNSTYSSSNSYGDIPSSPAPHLYSTPPTIKKSFRSYRTGISVHKEDDSTLGTSPPPLSTFYDGPLDGSFGLSQEEEQEQEEERYDSISSYRRDAGFVDNGVNIIGGNLSISRGSNSRKRTWASTLDDDEYYENGRGPPVRGGVNSADGPDGRGNNGGGKRRIIDVVGSVASKLWEAVKGNATWGFYYPTTLLRGGSLTGTNEQEKQQHDPNEVKVVDEDQLPQMRNEYIRPISGNSLCAPSQPQGSTSIPMLHTLRDDTDKSPIHRESFTTPNSPRKPRRTSNAAFGRKKQQKEESSPTNGNDNEGGLRASWVLVPQQEFLPTTSQRPSSSRSHLARDTARPTAHARSASAAAAGGGKKRPFRYPVKPITPTGNVLFDFGMGSPGGRRRKKSLSTGAWGWSGGSSPPTDPFGSGDEDEVDESMRRWNEQLKAMIREGKEALGSKVEVVYEDLGASGIF